MYVREVVRLRIPVSYPNDLYSSDAQLWQMPLIYVELIQEVFYVSTILSMSGNFTMFLQAFFAPSDYASSIFWCKTSETTNIYQREMKMCWFFISSFVFHASSPFEISFLR